MEGVAAATVVVAEDTTLEGEVVTVVEAEATIVSREVFCGLHYADQCRRWRRRLQLA